jgi:hypothetical protein
MAARFGLAAGVLQSHAIATYWVAPANGLKEMTTSYVRIVNTNNERATVQDVRQLDRRAGDRMDFQTNTGGSLTCKTPTSKP